MDATKRPDRAWKTASATYEGFPLLLRTPVGLDYESLRKRFSKLLTVEHRFSQVQPSGLPDAQYNESLAGLDHDLVTAIEEGGHGIAVLVETFGGKRTYYSYVLEDFDTEGQGLRMKSRFPEQTLRWEVRADPEWGFIRRYARDYDF